MKAAYVYILKCNDGSYYTGSTIALEQRISQHHQAYFSKCYTVSRLPLSLVYTCKFEMIEEAIKAERKIKGWSSNKKEALIQGRLDVLQQLAECENKSSLVIT